MIGPISLRQLVKELATVDDDLTLYAREPWTPDSLAIAVESDEGRIDHAGQVFRYLLESDLCRDVLAVWSEWRAGRTPTVDEACEAVIHYATHDAYLPAE